MLLSMSMSCSVQEQPSKQKKLGEKLGRGLTRIHCIISLRYDDVTFLIAATVVTLYPVQVYGHLGQYDKAALFCRRTLVRQLSNISTVPDAIEWSFNAATLSNYYSRNQRLAVARHCIACAQIVFQSFLKKVLLLY